MKSDFRTIRNKYFPFASKYFIYKFINFFLRWWFAIFSPKEMLSQILNKTQIKNLNIGGYRPVEGYLSIQLSPVELYGIPTIRHTTVSLHYEREAGTIKQEIRKLESSAISLHYNLNQGLPLNSNSLLGINMSHVLEHFTRTEGLEILKECYRVLSPGGVLRVSCPDLLVYAKAYVDRDSSFYDSHPIRMACCYEGLTTYGDRFISKAYDNTNGHKWFYDAESAIKLLNQANFTKIEARKLHDSSLLNIKEVEPEHREAESFYIEAIK